MNSNKDSLYYWPLFVAKCGGLHPEDATIFSRIRYGFWCISLLIPIILIVYGIYINNNDLDFILDSYQSLVLFCHAFGKHYFLRFNRSEISDLINQSTRFWRIDDFQGKIYKDCVKLLNKTRIIIVGHLTLGLALLGVFLLQAFITRNPVVTLYTPSGWDLTINLLLFYHGYQTYCSNYSTDTLFLAINTHIVVQFKLLCYKFENFTSCWSLRELIDYHNFLLDYCNNIKRITNFLCLLQFTVTLFACCLHLYVLQGEFSSFIKLKCLIYFISQIVQTAIYCTAIELLSDAASNISNSVYKSNWYLLENFNDRRTFILIVARAQKPIIISAYGLVTVNLQSFLIVMKAAFSFFTFLTTISERRA